MPKSLKWMVLPLVPVAMILSFLVYRWSDEDLTAEAQQLQVQADSPLIRQTLNYPSLDKFKVNPCTEKKVDSEFVRQWQEHQKLHAAAFQDLLEVQIKTAVVHSYDSITGFQQAMKQNRNWIRHFELHICFLQVTGREAEAFSLLGTFAGSVLNSLELIQPLPQVIQNLQLLSSAFLEMKVVSGPLAEKVLSLDAEKLIHFGHQFHFQSILNSIQNLKEKTKFQPRVFFPVLLIQPRRLMNQLAQVSMAPEKNTPPPRPEGPWYDVQNLEQIYISIFQRSVQGQRQMIEAELEKLTELVTDFGHDPR